MKRHRKLSNAGKVYNNSYNLICSKMFDSFIATRAIKIRSREIFNLVDQLFTRCFLKAVKRDRNTARRE